MRSPRSLGKASGSLEVGRGWLCTWFWRAGYSRWLLPVVGVFVAPLSCGAPSGAAVGQQNAGGTSPDGSSPDDAGDSAWRDGSDDAADTTEAAVEGCVDIWVDGMLLPEPPEWLYPMGMARHPFWRDEHGIHAIWIWSEMTDGSAYPLHLVLSSFDARTGANTENRFLNAFPADLASGHAGVMDVAGVPDGSFAVAVDYNETNQSTHVVEGVLFGKVQDPSARVIWTAPSTMYEAGIVDLAWDGEAFAVHTYKNANGDMGLLRFKPDGTLLLDETKVGIIANVHDNYIDFKTEADSGTTWVAMVGASTGILLTGHYRDGTPLPGTEVDGAVVVEAQGAQSLSPGSFPTVAYDNGGAVLAWDADTLPNMDVQHVDTRLAPIGQAIMIPPDHTTPFRYRDLWGPRTVTVFDRRPWLLTSSYHTLDSLMLGDTAVDSRHTVVSFSPGDCAKTDTCTPASKSLDVRGFSVQVWNDELWFGFWDYSDQALDSAHRQNRSPYRVVRVKEGCVYKSFYDVVMGT